MTESKSDKEIFNDLRIMGSINDLMDKVIGIISDYELSAEYTRNVETLSSLQIELDKYLFNLIEEFDGRSTALNTLDSLKEEEENND